MKHWFRISLSNLLIAAVIGVALRYAFVDEIPFFEYKYWLHAHSHLAMLGWVYLALFVLIVQVFIPAENVGNKIYQRLFWATQFTVWGMLVALIVKGYCAVSITFLIVHVLFSYVFIHRVWLDVRNQTGTSAILLRMSLVFLVISSLALWSLPVFTILSLQGSEFYYMAIQFFLHFQFNGWFTFSVLALFFKFLESNKITVQGRAVKLFVSALILSCFLTYALAVAWSNPLPIVFVINSIGVSLQFIALMAFCYVMYTLRKDIGETFKGIGRICIYVALGCFMVKILVQAAIVLPVLAKVGYTIRNFVIGFIHLIQLGVITMAIFGFAFHLKLLGKESALGAKLILLGFLSLELLLFVQGILLWAAAGFMPYYYESLVVTSGIIAVGVFWSLFVRKRSEIAQTHA